MSVLGKVRTIVQSTQRRIVRVALIAVWVVAIGGICYIAASRRAQRLNVPKKAEVTAFNLDNAGVRKAFKAARVYSTTYYPQRWNMGTTLVLMEFAPIPGKSLSFTLCGDVRNQLRIGEFVEVEFVQENADDACDTLQTVATGQKPRWWDEAAAEPY